MNPSLSELSGKTIKELKPLLQKRGLSTTGVKAVLVKRLYDNWNKTPKPVTKSDNDAVFVLSNDREFTLDKNLLKGIPVIDELLESDLAGELVIDAPNVVGDDMLSLILALGPVLIKNFPKERLDKVLQIRDYLGIDLYTRLINNDVVSGINSVQLYQSHPNLETLSPEELRGVLLEAILAEDTELLDKIFIKEFGEELKKNPYLFMTPKTWWIYERYTTDEVEVDDYPEETEGKIILPYNTKEAADILYNKKSYYYRQLAHLTSSDHLDLFFREWVEMGKPSIDPSGDFYINYFVGWYDDESTKGFEFAKKLVDNGLNINATRYDQTALIHAMESPKRIYNASEIIRHLIDLGVDPNRRDINGHTFLYYYIKRLGDDLPIMDAELREEYTEQINGLIPLRARLRPILLSLDIDTLISSYPPTRRNQIRNLLSPLY